MAKLSTYYEKKKIAERLAVELQQMEKDEELSREFDLLNSLKALMKQHDADEGHLAELLYRESPKRVEKSLKSVFNERNDNSAAASGPKKRRLMRVTNPHTGESIETRGGNTKKLKDWRAEYGKEAVDGWKEFLE